MDPVSSSQTEIRTVDVTSRNRAAGSPERLGNTARSVRRGGTSVALALVPTMRPEAGEAVEADRREAVEAVEAVEADRREGEAAEADSPDGRMISRPAGTPLGRNMTPPSHRVADAGSATSAYVPMRARKRAERSTESRVPSSVHRTRTRPPRTVAVTVSVAAVVVTRYAAASVPVTTAHVEPCSTTAISRSATNPSGSGKSDPASSVANTARPRESTTS